MKRWLRNHHILGPVVFVALIYGAAMAVVVIGDAAHQSNSTAQTSPPADQKIMSDTDIIQLINAQRQKVGSSPLAYSGSLVSAATAKANDSKASGTYTSGDSTSISSYLDKAGYKSSGSVLWVQPINTLMDSSDFVNFMFGSQDTKSKLLDGQFKDIGLNIIPINQFGVTSLVTLFIAKPYVAPIAPNTVYVPQRTYAPIYTPPTSIHCSSYELFGSIQTNCY